MKCPVNLEDVDLFSPGAQEHWYEAYDILHRQCPVMRLAGEGDVPGTDAFVLTKYEDIARVVRDEERFPPTLTLFANKIRETGKVPDNIPDVDSMIVSIASLRHNPELWRAHRQELTDPWVGPGATRNTAMITAHVDTLIDSWIGRDEIDFVHDFARPLPQMVMASVLGFPQEDNEQLAIWGQAQVMSYVYGTTHRNILTPEQTKEKFRLLDGFKEYVLQKVTEKRANPQDDMISFLTQVTYQALGRKLTDTEVNGIVYAMVIGGLETTQYALEEQAQLICEQPGLFEQLKADRNLIRTFIEEGMRLRSPTQGLSTRFTSQDEVFQGVHVPAGSMLHLRWAAANIDPDEWEDAKSIKLDRKAATRHVVFSAGPRICPGAGISRLEQTIAWNRLFDRLDGIAYAPGNTFEHQPGIMLGTLNLKLKVRQAA